MRPLRSGFPSTRWFVQECKNKRDEELVVLAKNGDNEAMEQLLKRYVGTVRARAREFFLLGGETDDLVQEGMIGLYHAINEYDLSFGKTFKNFAYLCVRRRIIDAVKKAAGQNKTPLNEYISIYDPNFDLFSKEDTPEEHVIDLDNRREFWVKLNKLLSDFEFRVVYTYLNGLSYKEICETTGKEMKSVDNALSRAKKKLEREFDASRTPNKKG